MFERERRFQDKLFHILAKLVKDKRFAGLELDVETEFPIGDSKRADIVVLKKPDNIPILVIETKRKTERAGYWKAEERFNPYGRYVVGQALGYAARAKDRYGLPTTPLFATANSRVLVLFSSVNNPWDFLDKKAVEAGDYENALKPSAYNRLIHEHRILAEKNPLREEFLEHLLDTVSRLWQGKVLPKDVRRPLGDWLINHLRSFVDMLSYYYVDDVLRHKLAEDKKFFDDLDRMAREAGYTNGISDIVGKDLSKTYILAQMMTYVLTNKIIFYKVLERSYPLPELKPILETKQNISSKEYLDTLKKHFDNAVRVTGDFEQIFYTGLFDHIVLSDEIAAMKEIDELIHLLSTIQIERFGDIVGYVYEDLIPAGERHQMGQFYTPPPIAELIVRWAVRSPTDRVLDPACGSGTFLIQTYWRLAELKTGRREIPSRDVHISTLKQIYGIDINPFATQLTVMNLAMKNVRAPTTEANIIYSDFFVRVPRQKVLAPYPVASTRGMERRVVDLPEEGFDAVIGNPPYTRWIEIPMDVRKNIEARLGGVLAKYKLHADVMRGQEPGIYIYFVLWAREFLKPGGRLGMIISDSWLQADYGVKFGRFLLENFKVKALIDLAARVFPVPLVGTCIILLEKPLEGENIDDNQVVFMYLDIPRGASLRVDEILQVVKDPRKAGKHIRVSVFRQGDLPKDQKWINFVFNAEEILKELRAKTIQLKELFEVSRGNYYYSPWALKHGRRPDVGATDFFYLNEEKVRRWNVRDYVYPALASPRYAPYFTFTEKDWEDLRGRGADCYFFMCHKPRRELSKEALDYIRWGETECRTAVKPKQGSGGKACNQALACQEREKQKQHFYGWYDLGGVVNAPIIAVRQPRYKTRFIWNLKQAVTSDNMVVLIPRENIYLDDLEIKALLAYLNSSYVQLYIESIGRPAAGTGPITLEVSHAEKIPVINVKEIPDHVKKELAALFDKLEAEARRIGGADKRDNAMRLWDTVIAEIDRKIAEILQLPENIPEAARSLAKTMMERRTARAEHPQPEAIEGTIEMPQIRQPEKGKRKRRAKTSGQIQKLDRFMGRKSGEEGEE